MALKLAKPTVPAKKPSEREPREKMFMPEVKEGQEQEAYIALVKKDAPFNDVALLGVNFCKYTLSPDCFRSGFEGIKEPQQIPLLLTKEQAEAIWKRARQTHKKRCPKKEGGFQNVLVADWIVLETLEEFSKKETEHAKEVMQEYVDAFKEQNEFEEKTKTNDPLIEAQLKRSKKK